MPFWMNGFFIFNEENSSMEGKFDILSGTKGNVMALSIIRKR